jgi:hypothetical protein
MTSQSKSPNQSEGGTARSGALVDVSALIGALLDAGAEAAYQNFLLAQDF